MPTLLVIRHAKSAWPAGVPDHERPLGRRGLVDAPEVGRWLNERDLCPRHVAVSSAVRAQQTWGLVSGQVACDPEVETDERIYAAGAEVLLDVVRGFPEGADIAALVGHNPGCEDLAALLAADAEPEARSAMATKYPTSGVAVLQLPVPWFEAAPGTARLADFAAPRG